MKTLPHMVAQGEGKHIVVHPEVHKRIKMIALIEEKTMGELIAEFASQYKLNS